MNLLSFDSRKFKLANVVIKALNYIKLKEMLGLKEILREIEIDPIELKFLRKGINLIIDGYSPQHIHFVMELEKMKYIKDSNINQIDLQLIAICEKLLPCIQSFDLLSTDTIFSYAFPKQKYKQLQSELKKIDVKYNLTKEDIIQNIYSLLNTHYFFPNISETKINKFKIEQGIGEYNFYTNYEYDRFTFDYLAKSGDKKILVDTINPGDTINIDKLRNKINYIKEEIFLNEDKLSLVIGVIHKANNNNKNILTNSTHIPPSIVDATILSKTVSSVEKLLSIIKDCSKIEKEDINARIIMIIDKEGISFVQTSLGIINS
ncbi:hypothetical protein [Clostridium ganghwense]|uniref:Uncharacterized protein n=1 Tax=Clostridium ganghwense TaxID=312089 RepID=A0ABT4CJ00_9CLOT|nr:hypothetical protein [Clostridium ganghwense]MCY6369038.1 hypothetical protein [Clostridium ganghwense]